MIKIKVDFDKIKNIHKEKLFEKCLKKIAEAYNKYPENSEERKVLEIIKNNLETILIGKKEELDKIIEKLDEIRKVDKLNDELKKIFYYEGFKKNKTWDRHNVLSMMNVDICPYCNRQYITKYKDKEGHKTTADLDHYYPQSKYPYLALSLYNFVPSCQICNSRMKGDKEGHLYPYEEGFGDKAIFRTSSKSLNGLLNSNSDEFEIEIKQLVDNEKIKKSREIFKLDEVYKTSHNQYILDMLHTIEHYPDSYLGTIADMFEKNLDYKEKDKAIKELREILKKPYKDRIERDDTLSKLTEDILREYDSYK